MAAVTAVERRRRWDWSAGKVLAFALLLTGAVIMAFPFVWMVLTSLKQPERCTAAHHAFPDNWAYFDNYPLSLHGPSDASFNSVVVTVGAVWQAFHLLAGGLRLRQAALPRKEVCFIACSPCS